MTEWDWRLDPEEAKARGYEGATVGKARRFRILADGARREADLLIREIDAAFDGVPRPKITLSVAWALDDEWVLSPEREAELGARDPQEDWREVKTSGIVDATTCFNFGDAETCRFYLPAFLTACLADFPFPDREDILWFRDKPDKTALLSERQMACLTAFYDLCERFPEHPSDEL